MKRVVLTTGGTGGHIFPALAVAEEIQDRFSHAKILFIGGRRGPEAGLAAKAGLAFQALPVAGVLGRGWRSLSLAWWLPRSLFQAVRALRRFRPDVVLGLGGYAGFSTVLAAWLMRIPTAIHEQNSYPGMTNTLLGKIVPRILLSMPDQEGLFPPDKVVVTGNPLRKAIRCLPQSATAERIPGRNVLVLGGSQGARAVNQAVLDSLDGFQEMNVGLWHQAGATDLARIRQAYDQAGWDQARVEAFIDDMAEAYAWADLVISRAGATTLAELTVLGKPSVLIPFPYATHDHQMHNARQLERHGAAMVLAESCFSQVQLCAVIKDLLDIPGRLRDMGLAASRLGRPDAGAALVRELEAIC